MSEFDKTVPHRVSGLPIRTLRIEVVDGPDKGASLVPQSDTISVGTAEDNDLVLTDTTVSRYHLELSHLGDRIAIQDHGSTNGTAVGKVLVEKATATSGTVLQLGRTSIRIDDGQTIDIELHDSNQLGPVRGQSPLMRRLMSTIQRAAKTDVSVLLLGETGVGKEVVAEAIHESSLRSDKPFETVDCGSLSPTLVASELFGHEKGAFTGADSRYIGAFERADGGTLFLDEVGEIPDTLQTVLLGALERRSFRRLGGSERIGVDVRVVCATNRDLRSEVNAGRFRQDVYYRIAVVKMSIPPLRDRTEDLPILVEHFLRLAGYDGPVEEIIPEVAMEGLRRYRWPGNVRELRNFVDASFAMGETAVLDDDTGAEGESSAVDHLPRFPSVPLSRLLSQRYRDARAKVLSEFESIYLGELLERAKGNVSEAARQAEIHRSYLIQMLKRHGLK